MNSILLNLVLLASYTLMKSLYIFISSWNEKQFSPSYWPHTNVCGFPFLVLLYEVWDSALILDSAINLMTLTGTEELMSLFPKCLSLPQHIRILAKG